MKCSVRKYFLILSLIFLGLSGCAGEKPGRVKEDTGQAMEAEQAVKAEEPVIGLILASEDAPENEEIISQFRKEAKAAGARLEVRIPEVSRKDAEEAAGLTESFVLCEVDPIEFQMLFVNEMVAEDADVIAILPNHGEALEPVLAAARAVGIPVCAFGRDVGEESCDLYAETEEAAAAVAGLLEKRK